MKILCPTDFSTAATNGIEYAAKLAQYRNATLMLLNVQPMYISDGVNLFAGGNAASVHEAKVSAMTLEDTCLEINRMFKISCSHEIIPSISTFEKIIAAESGKFSLTVLGTNGADNMNQFYLGSHSFRIANKITGPVLIIPEESSYKDIHNIIYVSGYHKGDELPVLQLKQFLNFFNPELHVIHFSEKDSHESLESYNSFCRIMKEALNYNKQITFERIINKNEAEAIESSMNKTQADLLAISMERHGVFYRLSHENVIKKLTAYVNYPVLVLHK